MSKSVQLQQSVLQGVASLLDDNEALKKLQKYIQHLKSEKTVVEEKEMSASEKEEILDDIREGLRELKLVRQGKLKSRPVEELLNEI
jgi:coenzyme F420-reducing hydrogenase delta subunit